MNYSLYDKDYYNIVIENNNGIIIKQPVVKVLACNDAIFYFNLVNGYDLIGCDYQKEYDVKQIKDDYYCLVLKNVEKTQIIKIECRKKIISIVYDYNHLLNKESHKIDYPVNHIGINTEIETEGFKPYGYTLIGWNTNKDGSGDRISLGSRVYSDDSITLYAMWEKWTEDKYFEYEDIGNDITITGIKKDLDVVIIPEYIENKKVYSLSKNCFEDSNIKEVILNPIIKKVESGAFEDTNIKKLTIFDSLDYISDYCISDYNNLQKIYINAAVKPVYSKSYYATFADKVDFLMKVSNYKKIVLFSGSSTRFGYDCDYLSEIYSDYIPVNMGVFAYTNAMPQLRIINVFMKKGDILIHAPEFDAAQRQFCTTNALDEAFFCMIEANYDLITYLDIAEYSQVFSSFTKYVQNRKGMDYADYINTPVNYDENGNESEVPVYNKYGDYILYRPNAKTSDPIYGLPVDYSKEQFSYKTFIQPLNNEYKRFADKGISVFFTYAPRNKKAIDEKCTDEVLMALNNYFIDNLSVGVLGTVEESLFDGVYLYGTDNHLSTEGVSIRTKTLVRELKEEE